MGNNPAQTGFSRVFLIEGGARPDHTQEYQSCMKAGTIEISLGDITKIECPDPNSFDGFIEVGAIKGTKERPTTQLMGRYPSDAKSRLFELARRGCELDVHVNFGQCSKPTEANTFTKKIIFEGAVITNYALDEVGALGSDERAMINETGDLSGRDFYEVLPLTFGERAGSVITNEIIDGTVCDAVSCGTCVDESTGCNKYYFITAAAGGSPSTPADVVFTLDGGSKWYAHDIDSLGAAENPTGIACLGDYLVVVSEDSNSLHYVDKDTVTPLIDPAWAEVSTGFVALKLPQAIASTGTYAFIVGDGGYVYGTDDPTAGVTVLDAGVATTANLVDVYALSDTFAVAVGAVNTVIYTKNQTSWQAVTGPTPAISLTCVYVMSEKLWLVGTIDGRIFYTLDAGASWTASTFNGSGTGSVTDIAFASKSVGYMTHKTAATKGRIFRTYDGGKSWVLLPEGQGTLPAQADYFNVVVPCIYDVNTVMAGGLADNGSDGIILQGED